MGCCRPMNPQNQSLEAWSSKETIREATDARRGLLQGGAGKDEGDRELLVL